MLRLLRFIGNEMIGFNSIVLITDDARMAAAISSELNNRGVYLVVLEGPRLQRPDHQNEIIRLANVIHRLRPRMIIYAKQPREASKRLKEFLNIPFVHLDRFEDLGALEVDVARWGVIKYRDLSLKLPHTKLPTKLAVVCEYRKGVVPIIAANYAIAHGADFYLINVPEALRDEVVDDLNKISSIPRENDAIRRIDIAALSDKLRQYIPEKIVENNYEKILFITKGIPYGLAISGRTVIYSDIVNLGHHLTHNIYDYGLSRFDKQGVIGLFVSNTDMPTERENELMADALLRTKGFSKIVYGKNTHVTEWEIMTLPYDFLYLATHGNQIKGVQNTYEFIDRKGKTHTVITKEGAGVASRVVFIEAVDGHTRGSPEWTRQDSVVWGGFQRKHVMTKRMPEPLQSESAMLRMRELVLGHEEGMMSPVSFDRLASAQRPLVIASACGSWTDLSQRFMYAGATAYIGTLWPITNRTATEFAENFFPRLFEMSLVDAFSEARNALSDEVDKLTYALSGSFESKHDPGADYSKNAYDEVMDRLRRNLSKIKERIAKDNSTSIPRDMMEGSLRDEYYYEKEIADLENALHEIEDGKNKNE